jgi:hypothetical protein
MGDKWREGQHGLRERLPKTPRPILLLSEKAAQVSPSHVLHDQPHSVFHKARPLKLYPTALAQLVMSHDIAQIQSQAGTLLQRQHVVQFTAYDKLYHFFFPEPKSLLVYDD